MKKILWAMMLSFLSLALLACVSFAETIETSDTSLDDMPTNAPTTENLSTDRLWHAIFPDYEGYDPEVFVYAGVTVYFTYDVPNDLHTNEEKRTFYQTRNQEFFEISGLSQGVFDDYYLSQYTPFVSLTYRTKTGFFEDFELLKQVLADGFISGPTIELNTVSDSFILSDQMTMDDLIDKTDRFFGTEIEYPTIDFEWIDQTDNQIYANKAYTSHEVYLLDFPENPFELSTSFFEEDVLIVIGFGHSGSVNIQGIKGVFLIDDLHLQVAIDVSATSYIWTSDYWPQSYILAIDKDDYHEEMIVQAALHVYYLNGRNADRPYFNSIDCSG